MRETILPPSSKKLHYEKELIIMEKTTNTFKTIRGEAFEALVRKAEKNIDSIYPLAIAIAYSNLNKVLDPEKKSAQERESVSNSGFNPRLMEARACIYPAVKSIENIISNELASYVDREKKTVKKRLNKSSGKIEIYVDSKAEKEKIANPEMKDSFDELIIGKTIDGLGLEIVNEIALELLELREKYGKRGKWLEKDVTILKPKTRIIHSKEAKIEYKEITVKPIQLAFRSGANFISAQRAIMNKASETVYLDVYTDADEENIPPELQYFLKSSAEYDNIGDVERIDDYIGKMNLTTREKSVLKWKLDGMEVFAIDDETGKKRKIHVSNPSIELMTYRLGVSERTINYTFSSIQTKAEKIGLKPEKLQTLNEAKTIEAIDAKTGEVIAEYTSANEASRILKIDRANIVRCVRGNRKIAGGYKWRYKSLRDIPENEARYKI